MQFWSFNVPNNAVSTAEVNDIATSADKAESSEKP
jgi:hypothetical protein